MFGCVGREWSRQEDDIGVMNPPPPADTIEAVLAYRVGVPASLNDRVAIWTDADEPKTPSMMILNRRNYSLTQVSSSRVWLAENTITHSDITVGTTYSFNMSYTDGTKLYADIEFKTGDVLEWDGTHWNKVVQGLDQDQVDSRVNTLCLLYTSPSPRD